MNDELAQLDAIGTADAIRRGDVSPTEVIAATIARIEDRNSATNAVIHPLFDKAKEAAAAPDLPDGPFRGVPMLLKDLWPSSAGDPFHLGVKGLKNAGYRHVADANITAAYRAAGFVIVGRTNTPELGLVATTEPEAYGPTRNPWDLDKGVGGSSGGSAAAVAAGMVPAANASDGGGSIRIPAAMCGLVGLKPSRGRLSMGPMQDEWGQSVQHVVCHTMRDCAGILDATAYPFPGDGVIAPTTGQPYAALLGGDPGRLRIGLMATTARSGQGAVDREIEAAVRSVAELLEGLGHDVIEAHPPALDDGELAGDFTKLWTAGAAATMSRLAEMVGHQLTADDVEPATWAMAEVGKEVTGTDIINLQANQHRFRREMAHWWAGGFDLLLTPTCAAQQPEVGELTATADEPLRALLRSMPYAIFTSPFNITGQPAISLPLASAANGLPIGVQFVADYGREDQLFKVGGQLEAAAGWADRRAPMANP